MSRFLCFLIQSSRAVSVPHAYDCCCCDIYNEQLDTSMIKRTVPGMVSNLSIIEIICLALFLACLRCCVQTLLIHHQLYNHIHHKAKNHIYWQLNDLKKNMIPSQVWLLSDVKVIFFHNVTFVVSFVMICVPCIEQIENIILQYFARV